MTCPFFNGIIDKHMCKLKFRVARVHLNLEKEEPVYENDISAENKTEKEGTWIPQENENKEWQKCFKEKKTQRKKSINSIKPRKWPFCFILPDRTV